TIVIITHEMAVIKAIANRVAVMENGRVVEEGSVYDIFSSPKADITRRFIESASPLGKIHRLIAKDSHLVQVKPGEKLVKMTFLQECAAEHVLTTAARQFGFDFNVVLANMEYLHGQPLGGMIGILSGGADSIENGIRYLAENHVTTEVLKDGSVD
ncbi:MAG: NIL domain-containing protein, partial [Clostridia bacterium]|nr:NIL domain-containing protein [Clostridia bacterium]